MFILSRAFTVYDTENTGVLGEQEIKLLFKDVYLHLGLAEPTYDELCELAYMSHDHHKQKFSFADLFRVFVPKIQTIVGLKFSLPSKEEINLVLRELFKKYDFNDIGYLDRNQIIALLRDSYLILSVELLNMYQVDDILETIDQNGDNKFDLKEVLNYMAPIIIAKKAFTIYDVNRCGYLQLNEIKRLLIDLFIEMKLPNMAEMELNSLLSSIDENNQGAVSFNELFKVLKPILESQVCGNVLVHKT